MEEWRGRICVVVAHCAQHQGISTSSAFIDINVSQEKMVWFESHQQVCARAVNLFDGGYADMESVLGTESSYNSLATP